MDRMAAIYNETFGEIFHKHRPTEGVIPAQRIARKEALLRCVGTARNHEELRWILTRIITDGD